MNEDSFLRSMTGFGSHSFEVAGTAYSLEVRSVNGRHGDVRVKLPWPAPLMEARLTAEARATFHRGRLDVLLRAGSGEGDPGPSGDLSQDGLAERLRAAHRDLQPLLGAFGITGALGLRDLLAYLDVLAREEPGRRGPPAGMEDAASRALSTALGAWTAMRAREGGAMEAAVRALLDEVEVNVGELETLAAEQPERLASRIRSRVEALLAELGAATDTLDASRLTGEIALAVDRADVTEELVRLRSHLGQFREVLRSPGPHGRKLDFLLQELHREINTTGAKAPDVRQSRLVVEVKAALEKVREIVQNLE